MVDGGTFALVVMLMLAGLFLLTLAWALRLRQEAELDMEALHHVYEQLDQCRCVIAELSDALAAVRVRELRASRGAGSLVQRDVLELTADKADWPNPPVTHLP